MASRPLLTPECIVCQQGFHWHGFAWTGRALAVLGLPIVFLVVGLLWVPMRVLGSGPALFRQRRTGQGGAPFTLYKLRTMARGANGVRHVTSIGRILRRWRIDELPQLVNIARGEMAWVGPRPESVGLARRYARAFPDYALRHAVRPGLTGRAQVAGARAVEAKLAHDLAYLRDRSLAADLAILAATPLAVLAGRGVN